MVSLVRLTVQAGLVNLTQRKKTLLDDEYGNLQRFLLPLLRRVQRRRQWTHKPGQEIRGVSGLHALRRGRREPALNQSKLEASLVVGR